jgi:hypothetical protein
VCTQFRCFILANTYPRLILTLISRSFLSSSSRTVSHCKTLSSAMVSSPTTSCSTCSTDMCDGIRSWPLYVTDQHRDKYCYLHHMSPWPSVSDWTAAQLTLVPYRQSKIQAIRIPLLIADKLIILHCIFINYIIHDVNRTTNCVLCNVVCKLNKSFF